MTAIGDKLGPVERTLVTKFILELVALKFPRGSADPEALICELVSEDEFQQIIDRVMDIPPAERAEILLAENRRLNQ